MQPAPRGPDTQLTVAAAVILFAGPAAGILLASPLRAEPVLQVLAFAGALFGLLPVFAPGLIAVGLTGGNAEITPSQAGTLLDYRALLVAFDTVLRDVLRFALVALIMRAEAFFRANRQVLYQSPLRMLPVGAACGFGLGLFRGLCVIASSASIVMTVEAVTSNAGFVRNAPTNVGAFVDIDSCGAMPLLVQQSAAHVAGFLGDIFWTTLFVPFAAAWVMPDGGAQGPGRPDPRWYAPTAASAGLQWALLALAVATHLAFGLVSLGNTGAFDWSRLAFVDGRGCGATLPVQAVVVLVAGAACLYCALGVERFPASTLDIESVPPPAPPTQTASAATRADAATGAAPGALRAEPSQDPQGYL
jgi:hypothetical protein